MYGAVAVLLGLAGWLLVTRLDRAAQSQPASNVVQERSGGGVGAAQHRIGFLSVARSKGERRGPRHELRVLNADGSGERVLSRDVWQEVAWSPDGERIAFVRTHGSGSDIHALNVDGSGEQRLTRSRELELNLSWSPDGRRLAFLGDGEAGVTSAIFVINADGSGRRLLAQGHSPKWLSDGRIAFFRIDVTTRPVRFEFHVMNGDGSGQRNLTRELGLDGFPSWSPDGRRVAWVEPRAGGSVSLMSADGSGRRTLRLPGAVDTSLAWSPDGTRFVFDTRDGGRSAIYVIGTDGSGLRRLTDRGTNPSWSPDGRLIAFRSGRDGNPELYVMNADGSGVRRLTRTPARNEQHVAWAPASTR